MAIYAEDRPLLSQDSIADLTKQTITHKLVVLGDSGVGKSSLVTRFAKDTFSQYQESTIGAAFVTKIIPLNDVNIKFDIWDTAGQERYQSLAPMYYRGAGVVLVVYDITSNDSFERAKEWVEKLEVELSHSVIIALVGAKCDLEESRSVSTSGAESYAKKKKLVFMETSAKTSVNVDELFFAVARRVPTDPDVLLAQQKNAGAGGRGFVIDEKEFDRNGEGGGYCCY